MTDCVFCNKIEQKDVKFESNDVVIFTPLNPVVPGHLLVVPVQHVTDFSQSAEVSARTMEIAAYLAKEMGDVNLITSKGDAATQTIKHLHIHLVPRKKDDGLLLPWSTAPTTKT